MIKKLTYISIVFVAIALLGFVQPAYAHFPVEDSHTGVKAVFHVTPDHDPIAGRESIISYDFSKTGLQGSDYSYSLKVKSTKDDAVSVPLDVEGNVILANYVFPSQGFYDITLTVTTKKDGTVSKLQYGQRVSRGADIERHAGLGPVETGLVVATFAIVAIAVFVGVRDESKNRKGKKK